MKKFFETILFTTLAASAAHAEGFQIEPRVFHSNLRYDSQKTTETVNGSVVDTYNLSEIFLNAPGLGVSGLYNLGQFDVGLGVNYVQYHPDRFVQIDLASINVLTRYNFVQSESWKAYALAGLSNQQLDAKFKREAKGSNKPSFDALLNYDLGLGGSVKLGGLDLGLEYKYSNTLTKGTTKSKYYDSIEDKVRLYKTTGVVAEVQELALTLGVSL